jgi:hypothetical protein
MSTETPMESPVEQTKRRNRLVARVFVTCYIIAVAAAALWLKKDIWQAAPLGLILGVPAAFGFVIALPNARRCRSPRLMIMYYVLMPLFSAVFIGGVGVVIAALFAGR